MGRCKMLTKHRSKSNSQIATQDSTSDGINLISVKRGITTPNTSGNSTSYSSENMNDSQDRSPEFIMEGSQKFEYEDMSPKINARLPKFKLNLDIPENDETDNVDVDKNNETIIENQQSDKELEKTLSVEKIFQSDNEDNTESTVKSSDLTKFYSINVKQNSELVDVPRKELTSLSGYFQIPSSTFNIPSLAESNTAEFPFLNGPIPTASISEKIDENNMRETNVNMHVENFNEKLYPLNNEQTSAGQCYISIEIEEKLISPDTVKATINNDKTWSTTPEHITHVDLPVISDIDSKTSAESQITILRNVSESQGIQSLNKISTIYYESVKNIFTKIIKFCSWLAGKFIVWIKKGYKGVRNLLSIVIASPDPPPLIESELTQVVAIIKCDNERLLAVLSEKVTSVSQDLIQVRVSNEANLLALTNEINALRETNSQLTESSNNLTKELKKLQEKVDDMKSNLKLAPAAGIANCTPVSSVPPPPPPPPPPPSISFGYAAPPPPPPPPPPPLPPSTPLGCTAPPPPPPPPPFPSLTPMMPFTKFTLNNSSTKTPASKCSTPLTSRPSITVEDLLKVTLKKAPANSMDNRRKTVPGPKGPVISLDMLREVKLKSARRRSLDQHKSPRSTSRLVRNRSQSNLSLSPTMMGAENSLSRILKPVDPNRKVFRRIQSIASNSETDLSKKETPSTKFSVGYCRKESVLI